MGAQVLRLAASRVGPLALRSREGVPLFSGGSHLLRRSVNDTIHTGDIQMDLMLFMSKSKSSVDLVYCWICTMVTVLMNGIQALDGI